MNMTKQLSERDLRIAAAKAGLDERTAQRVIAGYPTRSHARDRLVAALGEIGIDAHEIPVPTRDVKQEGARG